MRIPEARHAQEFRGLVEREAAAQRRLDSAQSGNHNRASAEFNPKIAQLEIELLQSQAALTEGGKAFNRSAPDLEGLRTLLETEINAARAVYAEADAALPVVPELGSYEPDAIVAHAEATLARAEAVRSRSEARDAAFRRLVAVFASVYEGYKLVAPARKAAGLPAPTAVLPKGDPLSVGKHYGSAPGPVSACDETLAGIDAQRHPPRHSAPSFLESEITRLQRALAEYNERVAIEAEKRRLLDEDPRTVESAGWTGTSAEQLARENVRRAEAGKTP